MYLNRPGQPFGAGHGSAGVTAASTNWFLAEGATGTFFDLFILIANPNNTAASVQATYMLPDGGTLQKTYEVGANSRESIYVDAELFDGQPLLASTPMSVKLVSLNDVPVIVERTMWWPDGGWYESHNAPGSTQTGARWALAEGEVGGASGAQTYILIANTSAFAGQARVTVLLEGGGEATRTYNLAAEQPHQRAGRRRFPDDREHALRHADRKPRRARPRKSSSSARCTPTSAASRGRPARTPPRRAWTRRNGRQAGD